MFVLDAGVFNGRSSFLQQSHGHPGSATERSNGAGARSDPSRSAFGYSVATGPNGSGKDLGNPSGMYPGIWFSRFTWENFAVCVQISTVAESEDSQESVDSVTDSQKRREILSRRPSYRSVFL